LKAPTTRGGAIAAHCKDCIYDPAASGTWREQVAACTAFECALWRFRPVQDKASCPDWIKSRDPADLPDGWASLEQPVSVRTMRARIAAMANARAVQANGSVRALDPLRTHCQPDDAAGATS
jgi:hypothetical protein